MSSELQKKIDRAARAVTGATPSRETELATVIKTWLTTTKEGRDFHQSAYNFAVLGDSVVHDLPLTVSKLTKHYYKLVGFGYAFSKAAAREQETKEAEKKQREAAYAEQQRILNDPTRLAAIEAARVAEEQRIEEELLASYWIQRPGEDSAATYARAMGQRHTYFAEKFGMTHLKSGFRK